MATEKKQPNTNKQPITEKEIRSALDTLPMNDACQGWRSMEQLTEAMSDIESDSFRCRQKVDYWFTNFNREDRYFETAFIDGQWCYRSHKFYLCRDNFLKTIKEYQQRVIRYPDDEPKLKTALGYELRAALQPTITARRQLKRVCT